MNRRYHLFFQYHDDAILFIDERSKRILDANIKTQKIFGLSPLELRINTIQQLFDSSMGNEITGMLDKAYKEGSALMQRVPVRVKSSEEKKFVDIEVNTIHTDGRRYQQIKIIELRPSDEEPDDPMNPKLRCVFALRGSGSAVWDWNVQLSEMYFSPELESLLGYQPGEFVSSFDDFADCFHPDDKEHFLSCVKQHFNNENNSLEFEGRLQKKDESYFWVQLKGKAVARGKDEQPLRVTGTIMDISKRMHALAELNESRRQYSELVESSQDIILSLAPDGRIIFLNQAAMMKLGIDETSEDMFVWDFLNADDVQDIKSVIESLLKSEGSETIELQLRCSDGSPLWIEFHGSTVFEQGEPLRIDGIARDITVRKIAEDELDKSQANLKAIIDNAQQSFFLIDTNYKLREFNLDAGNAIKLLYRKTIKRGERIQDILSKEDFEIFDGAYRKALRGEKVTYERRYGPFGEAYYDLSFTYSPVLTEYDKVIGVNVGIIDVSHQKRTEEELRKSKEQYKTISDLVSDFAYAAHIDNTGKFRLEWITEAFLRITGYSHEELVDHDNFIDIIYHEDRAIMRDQWRHLMAGQSLMGEYRIVTKNGDVRWLRRYARSIFSEDGTKVIRFLGAGHDITDQKQTEEALRKGLENNYTLITALAEGVIYIDQDGHIVSTNPSLERILGIESDNLVGRSFIDSSWNLIREDYSTLIPSNHPVRITLDTGEPQTAVLMGIQKPDDTVAWVKMNTRPIFQPGDKKPYGVVASLHDITELKELEERRGKLEEKYFHLSLVATQTSSGVILMDPEYKVMWTNEGFHKLSGYTLSDIIGKYPPNILFGDDAELQANRNIREKLENRESFTIRLPHYTKNNKRFWAQLLIDPMVDNENNHIGFICIINDITDRVMKEIELKEEKNKSDEMNKAKSTFIGEISYEVRSVMHGVLAYADVLSRETETEELRSMANVVHYNIQRILDTLNLVVDLSRLELDIYKPKNHKIDIVEVIRDSVELYKKLAENSETKIRIEEETEHLIAYSDERMLAIIINTLLSNTLLLNEKGEITIVIRFDEKDSGEYAEISILNSNGGFDREELSLFTESLKIGSAVYARQQKGISIGLIHLQKVVDLLGAELQLESNENDGTEFILRIPIPKQDEALISDTMGNTRRRKAVLKNAPTVLVVDDDTFSREVAKVCLRSLCNVDFAANGDEALQKVKQNDFTAILMDINLGRGLNGMEVTERVRNMPDYKSIPIIAMTAYAMKGDEEEFLAGGCDYYIAKPFNRDDLRDLMKKALKI